MLCYSESKDSVSSVNTRACDANLSTRQKYSRPNIPFNFLTQKMSTHLEQKRRQKQIQDAIEKYRIALPQAKTVKQEIQMLSDLVQNLSRYEGDEIAFETRGDEVERFLGKYCSAMSPETLNTCPEEFYTDPRVWGFWLLYGEAYSINPEPIIKCLLFFAPQYVRAYEVLAIAYRKDGRLSDEANVYEEARNRGVVFSEQLALLEKELAEHFAIMTQTNSEPTPNTNNGVLTPEPVISRFTHSSPTLNRFGYDKTLVFHGENELTFEELRAQNDKYRYTPTPSFVPPSFPTTSTTPAIQQKEEDIFQFDMAGDFTAPIQPRPSIVAATPTSYAKITIDSMFKGEIDCELENNYFEQRKLRKNQELLDKKRKREAETNFQIPEDTTGEIKKVKPNVAVTTKPALAPKQQARKSIVERNKGRQVSAFHHFNDENDESSSMIYLEEDDPNVSKTIIVSQKDSVQIPANILDTIKKMASSGIVNPFSEELKRLYTNILNAGNCFKDNRITNCRGTTLADLNTIFNELNQKRKNKDFTGQALSLKLSTKTYIIEEKLSSHVVQIQDIRSSNGITGNSFVLKFKGPNDLYEYYIADQVSRRVDMGESYRFPSIQRAYVFDKNTLLMEKLVNSITLKRAIDSGVKIEETLILYYTLEMLYILQSLHNEARVTHNSISPSNLLLLNEEGADLSDWSVKGKGWNTKGLMLIDYSNAIDLTLFPEEVRFSSDQKTMPEAFTKTMTAPKTWKYSADTWSVCSILHFLLFKKDMEVVQKQERYQTKETVRRFWKFKDIWGQLFDSLLNQDSADKPDYSSLIQQCQGALSANGDTTKALFLRFVVSLPTSQVVV